MHVLTFHPWVDIPLTLIFAVGFWVHFGYWARAKHPEIMLDLNERLPSARRRMIVLLTAVLALCWLLKLSVAAVVSCLILLGVALVFVTAFEPSGSIFFIAIAGYGIREWAFGFPRLVLHPAKKPAESKSSELLHRYDGLEGTALTPLRPCGDVKVDGSVLQVAADNGEYIDAGTIVMVTGIRNGQLLVRSVNA